MNASRWQAIGDIFDRAVVLPAGEQTAFMDDACGEDVELKREVASLIGSHRAAEGGFVQDRIERALSLFVEATHAGEQPVRVGPYRLIRELGRGGMGAVFLAERDDDHYQSQVAIKLVRPGMDTEFILARFRRERQTLARLQHPHISRLLDGGTTDGGLPYIVMEYIDGVWLTEFAAARALDVDSRLRLFLDVCSAVDYAHRQFIIHRDLKPGNILVDAGGVAKLVDFGICKLLRSDLTAGHDTVAAPLTPNYASPEQIRGEGITLLSDVYSLGAVLYELLTGRCPRQYDSLAPRAIEQTLDTPIVRPSVAAQVKQTARELAGDLDNIVLRALETEPSRRFESAAQLADDIRRYLDHEPVRARPQTLAYRALKFARRHRVQVSAAVLVFAALATGLAVSIYEARIAADRLRHVRRLADSLVFEVHDAVRDLPGATAARRLIVQTAIEFLDSAANAVGGDLGAQIELARAYRRLGDVEGDVESSNLGDTSGAQVRYGRAAALLDDGLRRAPGNLDLVTERIVLASHIGQLQSYTGKLQDAVATLADGIRLGAPFERAGPMPLRMAQADLYQASSDAKRNMNNMQGAHADATACLRLYQAMPEAERSRPPVRHALATAYASVGMAETSSNQLEAALSHFRSGVDEMETLVRSEPLNVSWNRDLMMAYGHVADALGNPGLDNLGDRAGALAAYRRAAAIAKTLFEADRANQRAASDYGIVLSRVETTMDDGDAPAKIAVQQESLRVLDQAARVNPKDVTLKIYQSLVSQHLGDSFAAKPDLAAAHDAFAQCNAIAESAIASGHSAFITLSVQSNQRLALNAVQRRRRDDALKYAHRALEVGQASRANASVRAEPRGLAAIGLTYAALVHSPMREPGDREAAASWLHRAVEAWQTSRAQPGFAAVHEREMREAEAALARAVQER